jgi:hypothetical protein
MGHDRCSHGSGQAGHASLMGIERFHLDTTSEALLPCHQLIPRADAPPGACGSLQGSCFPTIAVCDGRAIEAKSPLRRGAGLARNEYPRQPHLCTPRAVPIINEIGAARQR